MGGNGAGRAVLGARGGARFARLRHSDYARERKVLRWALKHAVAERRKFPRQAKMLGRVSVSGGYLGARAAASAHKGVGWCVVGWGARGTRAGRERSERLTLCGAIKGAEQHGAPVERSEQERRAHGARFRAVGCVAVRWRASVAAPPHDGRGQGGGVETIGARERA